MRDTPVIIRQPQWQRQCAETGPWSRLSQTDPKTFNTPWLKLGARVAELVRLGVPDKAGRSCALWLQAGSLPVGEHQCLAWVEMARGLLTHWAHLDSAAPDAGLPGCHVLAPTDRNFHPLGPVAPVSETLPKTIPAQGLCRVVTLMSAYDPCVRFNLPELVTPVEALYA